MSKPDNNHTPGGGQLIPITNMGEDVQAVLGRDLHGFLEVKTPIKIGGREWLPMVLRRGWTMRSKMSIRRHLRECRLGRG